MFTRFCETCGYDQKCHNENGDLFCIQCKSYLGSVEIPKQTA